MFSVNTGYKKMHRLSVRTPARVSIEVNKLDSNTELSRQGTVVHRGERRSAVITAKSKFDFDIWDHTYSEQKTTFNIQPVYVERSTNGEELVYNPKRMLVDKLYEVNWRGNKIGLLKNRKQQVIMYKAVE
jgi:hypothetical protein